MNEIVNERAAFEGKVAVLTGAASGMGLRAAQRLAKAGAKVVMCDINGEALAAAADAIRAGGGAVETCVADVRKFADAERSAALAVEKTGRIDLLVPFAGGYEPRMCQSYKPFYEQPLEVVDWGIAVNLMGPVYFARACMPQMVAKKGGVIQIYMVDNYMTADYKNANILTGYAHLKHCIEVAGIEGVLAGKAGALKAGAKVKLGDAAAKGLSALPGGMTKYLPDGLAVSQNGTKWVVAGGAKAGKVAFVKGGNTVDESKLGANPSGLKLTYKQKDGTFKGSFKAYCLEGNGKIKAYTANVTGVMIGAKGYGTATIKKVGSVAVTIE